MKIQEAEISNPVDQELKLKTKGVIILTDNRPKLTPDKGSLPDFRQSAFKQTEVDPFEPLAEITLQHEEDQLLEALNRKLLILEQRVKRLQKCQQMGAGLSDAVSSQKDKKVRRRFTQMSRNHKCTFDECARIYGSQTSLRHHLKLKHNVIQKDEQKQNSKTKRIQGVL